MITLQINWSHIILGRQISQDFVQTHTWVNAINRMEADKLESEALYLLTYDIMLHKYFEANDTEVMNI